MIKAHRFLPLAFVFLVHPLRAEPPVVSASVVVSAEAVPEEAHDVGVAVTVFGPAEIARSKASNLQELLRTVPGLDLVQSGTPGKVTSAFLRGANSVQSLVLIDGVKLNSPYFGGVDLSALPLSNIERIEIVRGPFSALYGSEAVGGVIQIFTRKAPLAAGFEADGWLSAGNFEAREAAFNAAFNQGVFSVTAGYRRTTSEESLPNDWANATNFSAGLGILFSESARAGVTVRRDQAATGIPFSGDVMTPRRKTTFDVTTVSVPFWAAISKRTALDAAVTYSVDKPSFEDPDDPWGFTWSDTRSHRTGGRMVLSHTMAGNRLSVGSDYEQARVRNEDSYGLQLDDVKTWTWSLFIENRTELFNENLIVTLGLRRDETSSFGTAWNPRAAVLAKLSSKLRLRAAAGTAFRSPTTGELYYPFSGNPDLNPEESASFETGFEWTFAPGASLEVTGFHTDVEGLIQYDYASMKNTNVGRARLRGIETVLKGEMGQFVTGKATYTYLDAVDGSTGLSLLRRPEHRASATLGFRISGGATGEVTGIFAGKRDDVDAVTYARVTNGSYFRLDLAATAPPLFHSVAPFVRVNNVLDRNYTEVAGFPSPGRRFVFGLQFRVQ